MHHRPSDVQPYTCACAPETRWSRLMRQHLSGKRFRIQTADPVHEIKVDCLLVDGGGGQGVCLVAAAVRRRVRCAAFRDQHGGRRETDSGSSMSVPLCCRTYLTSSSSHHCSYAIVFDRFSVPGALPQPLLDQQYRANHALHSTRTHFSSPGQGAVKPSTDAATRFFQDLVLAMHSRDASTQPYSFRLLQNKTAVPQS